jgi:hypothetical protein
VVPEGLLRRFPDFDRYRGLRLTFGMLGPHVVPGVFPFPARITHVVSEPLDLGDRALALRDEAALRDLHRRVCEACQQELDQAVAEYDSAGSMVDRGVRVGHELLRRLGL